MSEIEKVKQALLFRLDNLEGNSANEKFIKILQILLRQLFLNSVVKIR